MSIKLLVFRSTCGHYGDIGGFLKASLFVFSTNLEGQESLNFFRFAIQLFEILLKEFETKYLDLVRYLRLIRHTDRAEKVKEIRIKLMALKRSGQEVKPEDFPSLYN